MNTKQYLYYNQDKSKSIIGDCGGGITPAREMIWNGERYFLAKKDRTFKIGRLEITWKCQ